MSAAELMSAAPTALYPGPMTGLGHLRVSVVIPALNEAENLPWVLPRVPKWVHEVLLVDGHSDDLTVAVARKLYPHIRVVIQQGKGKGAALRSGFAAATGDIVVMLDADGSTDPAEIPAFVGALLAGADFAKGSRFVQGGGTSDMPFYRSWGNRLFVLLVRLLCGGRYSDLCYGYNAFWRRVLSQLALDGDGFEIETMMNVRALRARLKVAEVPSFEARRLHGMSNLRTLPDGWRVLTTIWRECWPQRGRSYSSYGNRSGQLANETTGITAMGSPPSGARVSAAAADARARQAGPGWPPTRPRRRSTGLPDDPGIRAHYGYPRG